MAEKSETHLFHVDMTNGVEIPASSIIEIDYVAAPGSSIILTLGSLRKGASADGKLEEQGTIVARLLLDFSLAKELHTKLGRQIERAALLKPK